MDFSVFSAMVEAMAASIFEGPGAPTETLGSGEGGRESHGLGYQAARRQMGKSKVLKP